VLLRQQVRRCKEALAVIAASAGEMRAESGRAVSVEEYLQGLVEQWGHSRPGVSFQCRLHGAQPPPRLLSERTLTQALLNILNNAADASPGAVELEGQWDDAELVIQVHDRGAGLSSAVSASVGREPVTTKAEGLGLGLFLAHAAIRRLGGKVSLRSRSGGGASTQVRLPLVALDTSSNAAT
jgi:two-component system sensor histidine kinase RegB